MREKTAVSVNAFYNALKTFIGVIVPFVTYTYIARVLGTDNLGKINFSSSILSYFQLLATLGITNYAISEGAKIRDDKEKFSKFVAEIFIINLLSTVIAYIFLFFSLIFFPILRNYAGLILINSVSMLFVLLGIDWMYGALEQYRFISIRAILLQLISLILVFAFVHRSDDVKKYMIIYIIPTIGTGIINFIYKKKFVRFSFERLTISDTVKHLKPIIIIWAMSIASVIYINSDMIMLIIIKGDKIGGLYSVSVKACHVCCLILSAIPTVVMPKLSRLLNNQKKQDFASLVNKTLSTILFFSIPIFVGLFLMNYETVSIIGGEEYIESQNAARIISCNILLSPINGLIATQIFIPCGKQIVSFYATLVGAILNIILNFFIIPKYSLNGAAFTTIISELFVLIIFIICIRNTISIKDSIVNILQCIISSSFIPIIYYAFSPIIKFNIIIGSIIVVFLSGIVYLFVQLLLRNTTMLYFLSLCKAKYKKAKEKIERFIHEDKV